MNLPMSEETKLDLSKLSTRLYLARDRLKLSQKEVAELAGMSQPTYHALESGKNKRTSFLPELSKALGVSMGYLSGEEFHGAELTQNMDRGSEIIEATLRQAVIDQKRSIPHKSSDRAEEDDRYEIPLMDISFSCGDGQSIEFHFEALSHSLPFHSSFFTKRGVNPENCRMLRASGDSMEPVIYDGDCFMIDLTDTQIRDGQLYAVYFEGEAMLKRIFKEAGGELKLVSENKSKYKEKSVNQDNGSGFKVIGRAIYRSGGL